MKRGTKTIIWGAAAVALTAAVGLIDVQGTSVGKDVGFGTLNNVIFAFFGENEVWGKITDILLGVLIASAVIAIFWAAARWAKEGKDSKKMGKSLACFGVAGGVAAAIYLIFEKLLVINYSPVLEGGKAVPSFPSTHVLVAVVLAMISAIILTSLLKKRVLRIAVNTILPTLMVWMMVGVILAGTGWFTDVIGGLLYGMTAVSLYQTLMARR